MIISMRTPSHLSSSLSFHQMPPPPPLTWSHITNTPTLFISLYSLRDCKFVTNGQPSDPRMRKVKETKEKVRGEGARRQRRRKRENMKGRNTIRVTRSFILLTFSLMLLFSPTPLYLVFPLPVSVLIIINYRSVCHTHTASEVNYLLELRLSVMI